MFNSGDVVKFRSREELQILYNELVVNKDPAYYKTIMSFADKTVTIASRWKNNSYDCSMYFLDIKGDDKYWLFYEEFFVSTEDLVPSMFGV